MQVRRSRALSALLSLAAAAAVTLVAAPGAHADATPTYGRLLGTFNPQGLAPQSA